MSAMSSTHLAEIDYATVLGRIDTFFSLLLWEFAWFLYFQESYGEHPHIVAVAFAFDNSLHRDCGAIALLARQ